MCIYVLQNLSYMFRSVLNRPLWQLRVVGSKFSASYKVVTLIVSQSIK